MKQASSNYNWKSVLKSSLQTRKVYKVASTGVCPQFGSTE